VSRTPWLEVNKSEEAVRLDISQLCSPGVFVELSPIDEYYSNSLLLLLRSGESSFSEQWMLRLLLLGQVSVTETYFRRILSGLLNVCPVVRRTASAETVALGAVFYYKSEDLGYGLIENASMSGVKEIKSQTQKVAGVAIPNNSSISAAIEAFDKVCHLRHATVHFHGELSSRNARELGIEPSESRAVWLTPITFQAIVGTCHNAVRAYNRFMFERVLERWTGEGLLQSDWNEDRKLFRPLHKLFYSNRDGVGIRRPYSAYLQFRARVLK